ncbi:MAG: hypothetical protein ACO4CT_11500 [Planctomycetota bacterium]
MDPTRLSVVLRRGLLPLALVLGLLLWWNYGTIRVPEGMDTLPDEYPAGTLCVVDKRPGAPRVGQVVFFAHRDGVLLSRIARIEDGFLFFEHAAASRFPDGEELGPVPPEAVQALLLTALVPDRIGGSLERR